MYPEMLAILRASVILTCVDVRRAGGGTTLKCLQSPHEKICRNLQVRGDPILCLAITMRVRSASALSLWTLLNFVKSVGTYAKGDIAGSLLIAETDTSKVAIFPHVLPQ